MSTKEKKANPESSGQEPRKRRWVIPVLLLASCFFPLAAQAQCAMCRAAIESEGNGVKAQAVNDGIIYLMAIPYILVAIIGYFVYKTGKKLVRK